MGKMRNRKKRKGFTLIELVVVIAILGILAAIAIPRFGNIQKNARIDSDISTANTIVNAAKVYIASENMTNAEAIAKDAVTVDKLVSAGLLESAPKAQTNDTAMALAVTEGTDKQLVFTVTAGTDNQLLPLDKDGKGTGVFAK